MKNTQVCITERNVYRFSQRYEPNRAQNLRKCDSANAFLSIASLESETVTGIRLPYRTVYYTYKYKGEACGEKKTPKSYYKTVDSIQTSC